ncbi:unnamed protein product, partial [Mesorhabditis belari]|uniref:Charged multivesicular body protein 4b n=1 Tax=Mesorhabditis belari TaxID=2138241 RepID=A0AAF3F6F3_9BILA
MSLFGKIFGGKKEAPPPSTQDSIQKLRETEELLIKKQDFLEKKIKDEVATAVKHGTKNKRLALHALNRKRQYEKQLAQLDGVLQTIEFQREALENASTNAEVLQVMGGASKALKAAHNNMDIDQVHDLMEDIAEQQEVANEIAEAISNPVGFGRDLDEDDLMKELEQLEQEELDKQLLDANPTPISLPDAPAERLPAVPARKAPAKTNADKDLDEKTVEISGPRRVAGPKRPFRIELFLLFITIFPCSSFCGLIDEGIPFELEERRGAKVECTQCASASRTCEQGAQTCRGDACFMRQCKHCPVYQFFMGCITLTPWQFADLQATRKASELLYHRVGASGILCEDQLNQTTCICNSRSQCNSIHTRIPHNTYTEGLFTGIINFDHAISKFEPRYMDVITGYQHRFHHVNSVQKFSPFLVIIFFGFHIFL